MRTTNKKILIEQGHNASARLTNVTNIVRDVSKGSFLKLGALDSLVDAHFKARPTTMATLSAQAKSATAHCLESSATLLLVFLGFEKQYPTFTHLEALYSDDKNDSHSFHDGVTNRLVTDYREIAAQLKEIGYENRDNKDEFNRIMMGGRLEDSLLETSRRMANCDENIRKEFVCTGYAELSFNATRVAEIAMAQEWLGFQMATGHKKPLTREDIHEKNKLLKRKFTSVADTNYAETCFRSGLLIKHARQCAQDLNKAEHLLYRSSYTSSFVKERGLGFVTKPVLISAIAN